MRRALTLSLTLLVLFTAAVWAGFYLAGHIAPERLRVETELSRLIPEVFGLYPFPPAARRLARQTSKANSKAPQD